MKELYINNKRIIIDSNTYIAFTQQISDLENVNIINIPSTKGIIIKRCKINDEIFGEIGVLTRINISEIDTGTGVLFNQIKKCEYKLFDNSILISKGILTIDSITETDYEITLYDEIIQKIEDLAGNVENGTHLLSSCPILNAGSPYTFTSRSSVVYNMSPTSPVCPLINIKDNTLDGGSIRCYTATGGTVSSNTEVVSLPTNCSSIQLRSIKNWELNYAYSIAKMIDSINYQYPNSISYSPELQTLFSEVHLLCNEPTNSYVSDTKSIKYDVVTSNIGIFNLYESVSPYPYLVTRSGHYSFDLFLTFDYKTASPSQLISTYYYDGVLQDSFNLSNVVTGTEIGKVWIKTNLQTGSSLFGVENWIEVTLQYNVNAFVFLNGGNAEYLDIIVNIPHECDHYRQILQSGVCGLNAVATFTNPSDPKEVYNMLNGGVLNQRILSSNSSVTYNSIDFRTGEIIDDSKIFPKVGIKDFVIQLAKFFNLDIIIKDSKLHIQEKKYYKTNELLIIDEISEINISNITFDKLQLTNTLPSSDYLTTYKNRYKQEYATQIINTGYSVRTNTKEIKLESGIPILLKDYNNYAYDKFTRYYNGGYSKVNHGVVNGFKDQIVFGFINTVNNLMYITDDSAAECGMLPTSNGINFTHFNPCLISETTVTENDANRFYFFPNNVTAAKKINTYYTFSPYKFSGSTILRSLEMNKPKINYAKITDANYNVNTTLYYNYHRNMLIDKYNQNTHIIKANIYINGKIDIYKIYNINNTNYIISNIIEYDPTKSGLYEIELMRVNDPNNYINNIIL